MSDFDNYLEFVRIFLVEDLKKDVVAQMGREWCCQQAYKMLVEARKIYEAKESI